MPYKDKLKDRGAHKELMRKRREGLTGLTGLTGVTEYPAVIEALVDPVEKIYHSLASHNVGMGSGVPLLI